jgi:glycosyltransferase involved in cell wall biosynthesis
VIYVCIPAHDEARTVGVLLWKIRNVMAEFGRDYELLVLDDASSDGTAETLERYRTSLPLTVVRNETPRGYAAAVDRLIRLAEERSPYPKRDCAVVLQADFTEDPGDIIALVKAIEGGADIVAGSVVREARPTPGPQRFARWAAPIVLGRTHQGAPVSDPLCGFRAYRLIVLKKALRDRGEPLVTAAAPWAANIELLAALAPHARRIEEAPLEMRYDLLKRESRFRPWRAIRELLRVRATTPWKDSAGKAA